MSQSAEKQRRLSISTTKRMINLAKRSEYGQRIYYQAATLADSLLTSGSLALPRIPWPINLVAAG